MISIKSNYFAVCGKHFRQLFTYSKVYTEFSDNKNKYISVENIKNEKLNNKKLSENQIKAQSKPVKSPQLYCMDCVKKYDFENYLSTILLNDSSVRRNAFTIRAFNAEISQIRDLTSTELLAKMRLQFWSDIIDEIFDNGYVVSAHNQPIIHEIQRCETNGKLSKHWFKKLIDSRMNSINLSDFPFQTVHDLEDYCDSTVSPVYYLIIESALSLSKGNRVLGNERLNFDHIASHLGRAQGLTNILRGVSHNLKFNRCYIPSDLLIKYKTSHEDFIRVKDTKSVRDVCYELGSVAHQHIETALSLIKQIERHNRLIFLPIVSVQNYLNRLQKYDFNLFDPRLVSRQGMLPMILWFRSKLF